MCIYMRIYKKIDPMCECRTQIARNFSPQHEMGWEQNEKGGWMVVEILWRN